MNAREQFGRETLPVNRSGLHSIHRRFTKAFAALAVLALCGAAPAFAVGPCTVTSSLDDGGTGTLRSLIADVNCDTINFQAALTSPIVLNGTQLTISRDLTITGPGASSLAISRDASAANFRIFFISSGTVTISGLTITNGNSSGFNGGGILNRGTLTLTNSTVSGNTTGDTVSSSGGGIRNEGTLTLTNSTVSGNRAYFGGGITNAVAMMTLTNSTVSGNGSFNDGGGILNRPGGTLTLTNSTVSRNTASHRYAGGIYNFGTLTLTNSTVSGNTSSLNVGGIRNGPGGTLTLTNSTVFGNRSTNDAGGGIFNEGTLKIKNTIVANNTSAKTGAQNCDNIGTSTTFGHNLSDTYCVFFDGATDLLSAEDGLGPLGDNGGPTETHALLSNSDAIDAVPIANCTAIDGTPLATDQRGVLRPQGPACDIGAFELLGPSALLEDLVTKVVALNAKAGILNSLDAKLDAALGALDDLNAHNDVAAINALQAFINAVEAQRGGQIEEAAADELIAAAQAIIDQLGG